MGLTDHYVTTTGSDTYANSTNIATPCSLSTALTALSAGGTAVAGDRIWLKVGAYTQRSASDTLTIDGTVVSPIVIQGYNGSINDLDTPTYNADGSLVTTNYPVIDYAQTFAMVASGADYIIWRNIKFTSAGTGFSGALLSTGIGCVVHQCYASNPSTNGSATAITMGGNQSTVENCDAALTGASGGTAAIVITSGRAIGNRVLDSQTVGIQANNTPPVIEDNVFFAAVVGPCIDLSLVNAGTVATIRGNTIVGKTTGIRTPNAALTSLMYFGDNHITDGTTGMLSSRDATAQLPAWFSHNRFRDNTTNVDGWDDWKLGGTAGEVTTDTGAQATDYVGYASDLYKLISTAAGFRTSTVAGRDIGALQHAEPTLPTASNVITGTGTYGYADALITPTGTSGGAGAVIGSEIIRGIG